jgi:hypothetical protein
LVERGGCSKPKLFQGCQFDQFHSLVEWVYAESRAENRMDWIVLGRVSMDWLNSDPKVTDMRFGRNGRLFGVSFAKRVIEELKEA